MKKKRMAKSARKFIRREKARIRREVLDIKEQKEQINKLYEKIHPVKSAKSGVAKPQFNGVKS